MESEKRSGELAQTLNIGRAVALAMGIVIGAGLLVLPGLAYSQAGNKAVYAWVVDALIVIPLLFIFGTLGSRYPSAGGVAGFVRTAFGSIAGGITEVVLMGAFFLGIPGIALTGANYLGYLFHLGQLGIILCAVGLLVFAGVLNYLGTQLSGMTQQILSYGLVIVLAAVAVVALVFAHPHPNAIAAPQDWLKASPIFGMVFFAFTGWEMLSFMGEEFRNPKRDFPIAVIVSFILVVLLYLGIAFAIQWTLSPHNPRTVEAPIAAILANVLGGWSGEVVSVIGVLIIMANLNGATWASSRLLFSSAREGFLPKFLAHVDPKARIPRRSILITVSTFILIVVIHGIGLLPLHEMFSLSGQNFFLLYLFSVIAYLRLVRNIFAAIFGLGTVICCLIFAGSFGTLLLYPVILALFGLSVGVLKAKRKEHHSTNMDTSGNSLSKDK
ncbi:APC family permease [Alicyclobacillus tolerans]|uniref:APC family permease n=1 Tax=Alicyclobacillus tolerans TaxID=90970 RepID=UPI003B7BDCA6